MNLTCNHFVVETSWQNTGVIQMIGSLQELLTESHPGQGLSYNKAQENIPHYESGFCVRHRVCVPSDDSPKLAKTYFLLANYKLLYILS